MGERLSGGNVAIALLANTIATGATLVALILTFGSISALYGLQNGIIDQDRYTVLVSVVILSAFVPTLIAQKFFQPTVETMHAWGRLYRKRMKVLSVEDVEEDREARNG